MSVIKKEVAVFVRSCFVLCFLSINFDYMIRGMSKVK